MTGRLHPPSVIVRKRDGGEIEPDLLRAFLDGYMHGQVEEEQMSAFLMAGVLRGFTHDEAVTMTDAFVASGDVVDLSALTGPTVDKHSTGGVGDTCTLVVAPILAACGAQVAKLSGRGLGHTGGTLDKLESIPGFRVDLTREELAAQVNQIGLAVAAATQNLVPLDKRLYALRDVTGTVPSPALIAASIMSKKIAGGADTVVLDVKTGNGAQMQALEESVGLARLCVEIGRAHGLRTAALVTDMSQPLAPNIGNALEVAHAIDVLTGRVSSGRFREVCLALASTALAAIGSVDDAEEAACTALESGAAAERFEAMVAAQHGDASVVERPDAVLPTAPVVREWRPGAGRVGSIDCRGLGTLSGGLGAGRSHKDDVIDPAVGLEVLASIGDEVAEDDVVAVVHARTDEDADWAIDELARLIPIGDEVVPAPPLIHARIGGER